MAIVSASGAGQQGNTVGAGGHTDAPGLRPFVMALFFIFGGITSLNDVIIPKLKDLFTLNYMQAMLIQTAFFAAYAIVGLPGAALVKRVGYMRGTVIGLLTMMAGCLLFIPASSNAIFGLFLLALFVLASGVTIVQVVANPLISLLGPPGTVHSRLTFAQAFNALILATSRSNSRHSGSVRRDAIGQSVFPPFRNMGKKLVWRFSLIMSPTTIVLGLRRSPPIGVITSMSGLSIIAAWISWVCAGVRL